MKAIINPICPIKGGLIRKPKKYNPIGVKKQTKGFGLKIVQDFTLLLREILYFTMRNGFV